MSFTKFGTLSKSHIRNRSARNFPDPEDNISFYPGFAKGYFGMDLFKFAVSGIAAEFGKNFHPDKEQDHKQNHLHRKEDPAADFPQDYCRGNNRSC